jgi:hypothetical protein
VTTRKTKSAQRARPTIKAVVGLIPFALGIRDGRRLVWLDDVGRQKAQAWAFRNPHWAESMHAAGNEAERRANCYRVMCGRKPAGIEVLRLSIQANAELSDSRPL